MEELLIELIKMFPRKNIIYNGDELVIIDRENGIYKKFKGSDLEGLTIQNKLDIILKNSWKE